MGLGIELSQSRVLVFGYRRSGGAITFNKKGRPLSGCDLFENALS